MKTRLDLAAVAVVTLAALVGALVLLVLAQPVPDQLWNVVLIGFGALTGAALPLARSSTSNDDPGPSAPAYVGQLTPEQVRARRALMDTPPGHLTADERRSRAAAVASVEAATARHLTRTDTGTALHPRPAA